MQGNWGKHSIISGNIFLFKDFSMVSFPTDSWVINILRELRTPRWSDTHTNTCISEMNLTQNESEYKLE